VRVLAARIHECLDQALGRAESEQPQVSAVPVWVFKTGSHPPEPRAEINVAATLFTRPPQRAQRPRPAQQDVTAQCDSAGYEHQR